MFFCFHRKNYNKAPLFWLSNILFWKTNGCNDIYNFYSCSLNVVDEYFVEFVHSLARKSTNATDTVDQMRQKLFSLFSSGERQANFRAAFTPRKNYVFSRREQTTLFSRVASTIVNILSSISSEQGVAHPLPRAPGQRRDFCLWNVPALFGDVPMKTDLMPLGFQFLPPPDQGKRCDHSECTSSANTPWKIFEGCWHSFHLSCLVVVDACPICRKGIEAAIKSLSATANKSVLTHDNASNSDGNHSNEGVEETAGNDDDDDDDGDDDELLTPPVNGNVDGILQNLTQQIMSLSVRPPPVQPPSPARSSTSSPSQPPPCQSSSRRPPHCRACGHLQQGHQSLASHGTFGKSCPVCPSQLCERGGRSIACASQWCSRLSQTHINPPTVVQETYINPDVTEWLISVSQSPVTPGQLGSNACTIIAVFGAVNFLSSSTNWILPSPHTVFKQLMIFGNQSYNCLSNQQPTYSAPEIINHPQLGFSGVVKCGDEYQFNSFSLFVDELLHLLARPHHTKLAAVLILPPDKSMLLLIGPNGEASLLESHTHLNTGAIIAASGPGKLKEMASYIEFMARRDWTSNPMPFDVTFVTLL